MSRTKSETGTLVKGNLMVGTDHGLDGNEDVEVSRFASAAQGAAVKLPYPEARYWGAARMGAAALFEKALVVLGIRADSTNTFADTTVITCDHDGSI